MMEKKGKSAIVLGATGLTGSILVQLLLSDDRYEKVILFSRSSIGFEHPKSVEYLGDLLDASVFENHFVAETVFCCIGTTKSKTPNKDWYRNIDYGIPVRAAEMCLKNGIGSYLAVSALGANPDSSVFYNRTKGEMEAAVLKMNIPKTHILQPSLISGKRKEKRIGEWLFKQFMKAANLVMVGPLEKYRSIHPESIAKCLIWLDNNTHDKVRIPSIEIKKLVGDD
jgi:uncharacterized protein YbjT (DUF2867 family)